MFHGFKTWTAAHHPLTTSLLSLQLLHSCTLAIFPHSLILSYPKHPCTYNGISLFFRTEKLSLETAERLIGAVQAILTDFHPY
jgi:hypothetical protein